MEKPSKLLRRTRSSMMNDVKEGFVGGQYQKYTTLIGLYTKAIAICTALEQEHEDELVKNEISFNQNH